MSIFVTKGDAPLSPVQLERRSQKHIKRLWPAAARENSMRRNDRAFDAFMTDFSSDHDINTANNTFNWNLSQYRNATQRLAKYVLSVGRAEVRVDEPTGEYDAFGEPVTESHLQQSAIGPLDSTVLVSVYDGATETSSEQSVPNPLIVADAAERTAAQAIVDGTSTEVQAFNAGS
jgi:hypothetical protein